MTLKKKNGNWSLTKLTTVAVCVATVVMALPVLEEHCVAAWHGCKRAAEPWFLLPAQIETLRDTQIKMDAKQETMAKDISEIKITIGARGYTTNRSMQLSQNMEDEK